MLFYLPVEILLHVGSYFSRGDLIPLATTCKGFRKLFRMQLFGGTVCIRSPLPDVPDIFDIFNFLHQGMPGLQKWTDQVAFYRQQSDLARSVHTVQLTNWTAPYPQRFLLTASKLAENNPEYQFLLEEFQHNQYYPNALMQFCSVLDSIVVNLVQCLPFSELRLIRTHITPIVHHTLHTMATLRRVAIEDCFFERVDFSAHIDHIGRYESFKATSGVGKYLLWHSQFIKSIYIQAYLFGGCSTITKLEICIEFLRDDALDRLSFPSLTSLAIVPHANFGKMWSWGTVYRLLKISPNTTYFKFEPIQPSPKVLYPFAETTNWKEHKSNIANLPLSQLSSITTYRQLVKHLVPGRPVSFVQILLFPDVETREFNWPEPESDDEVTDDTYHLERCIVPYQLVRSTTPVKTLYLQCIDELEELKHLDLWAEGVEFLHDACPYLTDLWLPALKFSSRRRHYRDPDDMKEVLDELRSWDELEWCAVGPCSPWMAKELEWHREGTIVRERVHPTLKELLLGIDVLWKWQDNSEARGWVLYVSTDIEGSEDSEEGIYPPDSRYADSMFSLWETETETDSDSE